MERLTHKRSNGIKAGYWSPNRKEELIQRLAAYENTGLTPEEIKQLKEKLKKYEWIPAEAPPETEDYILLSFDNFSLPAIGRYEGNQEGGSYYLGDEAETCLSHDLYVNAWQPLPESYHRGGQDEE